jgi:hypothetical protein
VSPAATIPVLIGAKRLTAFGGENKICAQRILNRINASAHPRINFFAEGKKKKPRRVSFLSEIRICS